MRTRISIIVFLSLGLSAAPLLHHALPIAGAFADDKHDIKAIRSANNTSVEGAARLERGRQSIELANPALPFGIAAIELQTESKRLPRRVRFIPRAGEIIVVEIPEGSVQARHAFDPPLETEALMLEIDRGAEEDIELRLITDATPSRLIDALENGGSPRLRARALLPALGSAAMPEMEARFETLTPRAQRDLITVYGRLARDRRAAERLLILSASAEPEDEELAQLAVEALPAGLLGEAIKRGSRPALRLAARGAPGSVLRPLLETLALQKAPGAHEGGGARLKDVRGALSAIARNLGDEAAERIGAALAEESALIRARSLAAWSNLPTLRALVEAEILALSAALHHYQNDYQNDYQNEKREREGDAIAFEIRYRALEALAKLDGPVSEEALALAERSLGAEEWMIRALAYEALSAHRPGDPALLAAFDDDYPRVRLLAAARSSELPTDQVLPRLREAADDPFPFVREGAIRAAYQRGEALGTTRDGAAIVRLAVYERMAESPAETRGLMRALEREPRRGTLATFLGSALARCDARFLELAQRLIVTADTRDDESAHAGKSALTYLLSFEGKERETWIRELERRGAVGSQTEIAIRCAR